jgi:hypothetical protein
MILILFGKYFFSFECSYFCFWTGILILYLLVWNILSHLYPAFRRCILYGQLIHEYAYQIKKCIYCHVYRVCVCGSVTNNNTWIRIGYRIYSLWRFIAAQITITSF